MNFDVNTYRAKHKELNKWVFGGYKKHLPYQPNPVGARCPLEKDYVHYIVTDGSADWGLPREPQLYIVDANTVCQCTGKQDAVENYIFEGDILESYLTQKLIGIVKWDDVNCRYIIVDEEDEYITDFSQICSHATLVIGNIFESTKDKLDNLTRLSQEYNLYEDDK